MRNFLLTYPKIKSAEIAAFGTIALRGAIDDVGRALEIPLQEVREIKDRIVADEDGHEDFNEKDKKKYPDLVHFVNLLQGVITSVGTHPAGVLCATMDIDEEIGLFSLSTTEHPVSCLDMHWLDTGEESWTKLDMLGLDTVGLVNETCKLAGIPRCTPDTIDINDWEVWKDIRDDTTSIFQWNSDMASHLLKNLFSDKTISKIKKEIPDISLLGLFSFGNALIRPCGATVREEASNGKIIKTGIKELDDMLKNELGRCLIQEDFMKFAMKFCGFSQTDADKLRKTVSKKGSDMPETIERLRRGFYNVTRPKYMLSDSQCDKILEPILQCISDASRYAFSNCHSIAYSFLGYACGWLRHYYPLEYVATCLNVWKDKEDKTAEMMRYAGSHGIKIRPPKFRYSRADYFMDKETNSIYKGIRSVKYMNDEVAEQLYALRDKEYDSFFNLLKDIKDKTSINSRQLNILIRLDFFSEFGNAKELGVLVSWFDYFKQGEMKTIKKEKIHDDRLYKIIQMNSKETAKSFSIVNMDNILNSVESLTRGLGMADFTIREKMIDQMEYYGYIDISTGNMSMEERKKLIVMDIRASRTKKDNKIWAYFIKTQSVGSGKHGEFAILAKVFDKMELQQYDIIQAKKIHKKEYNGRVTWYLDEYSILSDI